MSAEGVGDRDASPDGSLFADSEFRAALRDLPPSAKLVAKVLDVHGALDRRRLAEETVLPGRTVRYALTRLEDAALVTSRVHARDPRKRIYRLRRP